MQMLKSAGRAIIKAKRRVRSPLDPLINRSTLAMRTGKRQREEGEKYRNGKGSKTKGRGSERKGRGSERKGRESKRKGRESGR